VAALLAELGQLNSAREYLHQIGVENTKQDLQLYLLEGELLRRAGLYQEAGEFYDAALEALPDSHELLYARALNAERLDDLAKAESDLQRIISADPDNAQALNALGYTLADRTQRYDEALGYIRRALELQPDAPEILDSMGWVQYRLGNYPEALNYLRRAVETMPDAEIAAHLGEVLWVSGDQGAARVVWEEALKKEPAHDALLRTMKQFGL
jgi:tetratricopeptide (TPR) repeat protein